MKPESVPPTTSLQEQIALLSRQISALSEQISELQKSVNSKSIEQKTLLTRKDAAAALSISVSAVDQLIVRGDLKVRRIGKRLLVPRKELERLAGRDVPELWPSKQKL